MSHTYYCEKGCCSVKIKLYDEHYFPPRKGSNRRKAGVFLYDPKKDSILLVQSYGHLWGFPKGTLKIEENESNIQCAIREVKEETGLSVNPEDFTRVTKIKSRAIYYYLECDACDVDVQIHDNDEKNDANGITWIKIHCLEECILSGKIVLNQHCKIAFKRFMNKIFPKSDFVTVKSKNNRKNKSCSKFLQN